MIVRGGGVGVLGENMIVLGGAVQEEEEVQGDTVDLDHNYLSFYRTTRYGKINLPISLYFQYQLRSIFRYYG